MTLFTLWRVWLTQAPMRSGPAITTAAPPTRAVMTPARTTVLVSPISEAPSRIPGRTPPRGLGAVGGGCWEPSRPDFSGRMDGGTPTQGPRRRVYPGEPSILAGPAGEPGCAQAAGI